MDDTLDNYENKIQSQDKIVKFSDLIFNDLNMDNVEPLLVQSSINSTCKYNNCDKIVYESYVDGFSLLSKRPCYSNNVTKMILNPIPDPSTNINSITDGTLTINFNQPVRQFRPSWYWGDIPCVESTSPPWSIFTNSNSTIILDLSSGVNIFGFELCLDYFFYHYDVNIKYYSGSTLLGSVTRYQMVAGPVQGYSKVFEVCSANQLINKVIISTTSTDGGLPSDFFIAQIYYGTDNSSCCNCNNRDMDFEFDINLNPNSIYNLQTHLIPQLEGITYSNLQVKPITGIKKESDVTLCNESFRCCLSYDGMRITAKLNLLISIPCIQTWIDPPGMWICSSFSHTQELDLDQICLICPGAFNPNINLEDLLELVCSSIDVSNGPVLHVKCTIRFKCPKICC